MVDLFSVVMSKEEKKSGKKNQQSKKMPILLKKGVRASKYTTDFPYLMPGNGPLTLKKGCIILGKAVATGLVIHSREHFDRLYERLKKYATSAAYPRMASRRTHEPPSRRRR